ncbi:hypothetical protein TWF694_008356 [Orbilia ellipsospora]|uniref:Nucleotide exchange factor SIL1 n=1 Tax=Orbilia ellipsospora TaxID=2528407 RepID=A0AAV9XGT4_9PEZI
MNGFNRIAVIFLFLFSLLLSPILAISDLDDTQHRDPDNPLICHPGKPCYPKTFIPTTTFRSVEPDQIIPTGLHVRLNIGTGGREAKLIDPSEDAGHAVYVEKDKKSESLPVIPYSDLAILPDQDVQDGESAITGGSTSNHNNTTEDSSSPPVQHIPPPEDKLKPNPHLSASDWEIFNTALATLQGSHPANKNLPEALSTLSDLSHEPEYGVKLVETALSNLITILVSESYPASVRSSAAIALGNSLQNNAVALSRVKRIWADRTSEVLFKPLVKALEKDWNKEKILGRRLMFAVSRVVRVKDGKEEFVALGGLQALEKLYVDTVDLPLKGKIATFLQDEFLDMEMVKMEGVANVKGGGQQQKVLKEGKDNLAGWCDILQEDLVKRGHEAGDLDSEVKVLSTLKALKERYEDKCLGKEGMKAWLDGELERVKKEEEEDADWIKVPLQDVATSFFGVTI